ncbi:MAG TPA: hypothetical protein VKU19_27390 [Bryobacteraceae bacterium]|nr:hypothetical protein [Bryobacteraceae bacterium]
MNRSRMISLLVFAGRLACGHDGTDDRDKSVPAGSAPASTASRPAPVVRVPKVLRGTEPVDSRVVVLPGAPRRAIAPPPPPPPTLLVPGWHPKGVPALPQAPEVTMVAWNGTAKLDAALFAIPMAPRPEIPALPAHPRLVFPAGLAQESAVFCQREIGHWTLPEAHAVLGEPVRQRAALDDNGLENGRIYAFKDPTSRYREVELDFDKDTGILRTVFVYPWNLTWQDCRKLWGTNVSATGGNKGRVFYSYVNRHLDVLVDHDGKVISLGLY